MAFKEYIQLHVCVRKGTFPRGKWRGEKETLLIALNRRVFKMGKRHISGSLHRTAVLWGVSLVCIHRLYEAPR